MFKECDSVEGSERIDAALLHRVIGLLNEVFFLTGRVVVNVSDGITYVPQSTDLPQ